MILAYADYKHVDGYEVFIKCHGKFTDDLE